jgi:hypothetical protein
MAWRSWSATFSLRIIFDCAEYQPSSVFSLKWLLREPGMS